MILRSLLCDFSTIVCISALPCCLINISTNVKQKMTCNSKKQYWKLHENHVKWEQAVKSNTNTLGRAQRLFKVFNTEAGMSFLSCEKITFINMVDVRGPKVRIELKKVICTPQITNAWRSLTNKEIKSVELTLESVLKMQGSCYLWEK